jgi:hypothetical protein
VIFYPPGDFSGDFLESGDFLFISGDFYLIW